MREFAALTPVGRSRRVHRLAAQVVAYDYQLEDAVLRRVAAHSFNSIYRVVGANSRRYALRVGGTCRIHQPGLEDVEAAWLDALAAAGIVAPVNQPTAGGRRWVTGAQRGVPEPRVCSLFSWLDGVELRRSLSEDGLRAAGSLLAELHEHAASIATSLNVPPALHATQAVYFHEVNKIAGYASVHGALFVDAMQRVQEELDGLWKSPPHGPHLLHGDFGPHNVLTSRGQLFPIDFQDLRFGFDLQDVALSLADLRRRAPELVPAFTAGYEDVRSWPDLSPIRQATFAAERSLNIMNLGLHLPDSGIGRVFDDHAQRVVAWMKL